MERPQVVRGRTFPTGDPCKLSQRPQANLRPTAWGLPSEKLLELWEFTWSPPFWNILRPPTFGLSTVYTIVFKYAYVKSLDQKVVFFVPTTDVRILEFVDSHTSKHFFGRKLSYHTLVFYSEEPTPKSWYRQNAYWLLKDYHHFFLPNLHYKTYAINTVKAEDVGR